MSLANKFNIPPALFETIKRMNEGKEEYQAKVKALMAKRGIKSLADLSPEEKKDFFNTLDSMHKAKNEEVQQPVKQKTVTVKHKTSGKELVVTPQKAKELKQHDYHPVKEEVDLEEGIPKSTGHALVHSSSGKIIAKGNKAEMQKKMKELNTKEKGSHYVGRTNRGKVGDTFGFGSSPADKLLVRNEEVELDEAKSSTGYDLYHKDFSSAMAHAYDFAKKKYGIEIDPTEIDRNVAMGPRKPGSGKANAYRLLDKTGKKAIQVQVANLDNKRYELNMYKEDVDLEEEQKHYSIVHKTTKKVLSTHKNLDSAKDEHRGMDQGVRAHYYIATSTKEPKTFNMKEDVEQIDEVKVGDKVSFSHSVAAAGGRSVKKTGTVHQIDGDTVHVKVKDKYGVMTHKKKASDLMKEDAEQIDELSRKTLKNYAKKAEKSYFDNQDHRDINLAYAKTTKDKTMKKGFRKGAFKNQQVMNKRRAGFDAAHRRMPIRFKEEVEQIDELSKKTLASYTNKAAVNAVNATSKGNVSKGAKRLAGIGVATKKLANSPQKLDSRIEDAIKKIQKHMEFWKSMGHESIDNADFMKVISLLKKGKVDLAVRHAMSLDSDPRDFLLTALEPVAPLVGRKMSEEVELTESHFEIGDDVICKASGMEGEVVKIDEPQTGKYYTVKREDGKMVKYAPDELKAEDEDEEEDDEDMKEAFSPAQIDKMRQEYGKIKGIDPASDTYKKLTAMLDKLDLKTLQSLAGAKIKFVSGLAQNRVVRKMNEEVEQIDELSRSKLADYVATATTRRGDPYVLSKGRVWKRMKGRPMINTLETPLPNVKDALERAQWKQQNPFYTWEPDTPERTAKLNREVDYFQNRVNTRQKGIDRAMSRLSKGYANLKNMKPPYHKEEVELDEVEQIDEISAETAKSVAQKRDLHFRKGTPTETQKRRMGRGDWRADPSLHADKARQSAEKRGAKDVYDYNKKEEVEFDEASNPQVSMKRAGLSVERAKEVMRHQKEIGSIRKKREALRNSYDPAIIEAYKKMKNKKNEVTKDDNQIVKSSDKLSGKQEPIELEPELKEQKS